MRNMLRILALVILATAAVSAADPPYVGKWKMNTAKSDFGQTTVTYEAAPEGGFKATMDGVSYTFKTDEKEYPTPWGSTTAWKAVDATTWEITNRSNGKVTDTATAKLSADGKTITLATKSMTVTGGSTTGSMEFKRVSGGPGLTGKWQTAKMNSSSMGTFSVAMKGTDGLTLTFTDINGVCDAKLDGKDYPAKGPMWPAGWTCAMTKSGDTGFAMTWKKDGKPLYQSTFSVSADGKTMTETGGAVNTTEKVKVVYDKQ